MVLAAGITAGAVVYSKDKERKTAHSAADKARRMQQEQIAAGKEMQIQAGEHWEQINSKQMLMQQQENKTKLLSQILADRRKAEANKPPAQIYLPAKRELSVSEKINEQIGRLFGN